MQTPTEVPHKILSPGGRVAVTTYIGAVTDEQYGTVIEVGRYPAPYLAMDSDGAEAPVLVFLGAGVHVQPIGWSAR